MPITTSVKVKGFTIPVLNKKIDEIYIPKVWYFRICFLIGSISLVLGFNTLIRSGQIDSTSSAVIDLSLRWNCLAITIFYIYNYALLFHLFPKFPFLERYRFLFYFIYIAIYSSIVALLFTYGFHKVPFLVWLCPYICTLFYFLYYISLSTSEPRRYAVERRGIWFEQYSLDPLVAFVIFITAFWCLFSFWLPIWFPSSSLFKGEYVNTKYSRMSHILTSSAYIIFMSFGSMYSVDKHPRNDFTCKLVKLFKFLSQMAIGVLFQHYFKLTSFDQVKALLCFALAWLANLAILRPFCGDFWIFDFLLTIAIMGSTANKFEILSQTWIAFGASVILYGLRLGMNSLTFVIDDEYSPVDSRLQDDEEDLMYQRRRENLIPIYNRYSFAGVEFS